MSSELASDLKDYVRQAVASGAYRSEEELLSEALRLHRERHRRLEALQADIDIGAAQLNRGESIEIPDEAAHRALFEDIRTRGLQRLAERRAGE